MKTIEIDGIKYSLTPINEQKPQTLYDLIVEWVNDNDCSLICELMDKVASWLPEEIKDDSDCDEWNAGYNNGYNHYRNTLLKKLK